MGRKSELNQTIVNNICNKITAEGNIPTVDRVRLELGTGSRTTINRMIREYEKHHNNSTGIRRTKEMEQAFDTIIQVTAKMFEEKLSHMQSQIDECNGKVQHYLKESDKHLTDLEEYREKYENLKETNRKLEVQLENKNQEIIRLEHKVSELLNINQLFKMLQMENAVLQKQNQENKEENSSIRKQFEHLMDRILQNEHQFYRQLDNNPATK